MRRLLRILFNALTVLSLVLAVSVAGLWARSYWTGTYIKRSELSTSRDSTRASGVQFSGGCLVFNHAVFDTKATTVVQWSAGAFEERTDARRASRLLKFGWYSSVASPSRPYPKAQTQIIVPL